MKHAWDEPVRIVGTLLTWWVSELKSLGNDMIALLVPQWRVPVRMYADKRRLIVIDGDAPNTRVILDLPCAGIGLELPDSLPECPSGALERGRRIRLIISTEQAFIRRLRMPLAALPYLKTALSLQLPKLLPLAPSLLFTDYEVTGADTTNETIEIDLASIKRNDIEPLERAIRGWGLHITAMHLGESANGSPRFRFATNGAPGGQPTLSPIHRRLLVAAAVLGIACAAVATTQSYRADRTLARAKQQTTVAAGSALVTRKRLYNKLEPLNELSLLESAPSAAALLTEITALVPHDSWLTTLDFKEHHLRMVGISPDSATLVQRLSSSTLLTDVELRSSMSAGIGTGKDRFEITADLNVVLR